MFLEFIKDRLSKVKSYLYENRRFFIPLTKELREDPAARMQRAPLRQYFKDTFSAFLGKNVDERSPGRLGLFDYLTLGIPRLLVKALFGLDNVLESFNYFIPKTLSFVPWVLGGVIDFILSGVARYLVAAVATVVLSPVLLVTYLISSFVGLEQYDKALRLKNKQNQTLDEYLFDKMVDTNDLRLRGASIITNNEGTRVILMRLSPKGQIERGQDTPLSFDFEVPAQRQTQVGRLLETSQATQSFDDQSQTESIQAALGLNMFKTRSRILEKSRKVDFGNDQLDEIKTALGIEASLQA